MKKLKFYWHIHHDTLLESRNEPIKNRIKYIKENKPKDEIKLRLKLLKPVKGKLPNKFIKAKEAYDEAILEDWLELREIYFRTRNKKWKVYNEAMKAPGIIALHKKECPNCPWTGSSIFAFREWD